jgi:hypothetical protein
MYGMGALEIRKKVIISCPDSYGKETVFVSVLRADHVLTYRTFYSRR